MIRLALVVIVLLAAACSMPSQGDQGTAGGQPPAGCPHRVSEASAWVNYMPGPARGPRELHVDVQLADVGDTVILIKSAASTADSLILEMRTTSAAPIPGRAAYREPASDPLPKRIILRCQGGEIDAITRIEKVY
ncbi:MAG TPA: hypothetical protein VIA80_03310 [Hyphomonadaceae bacterium]|jgi:hypothetical protein